MGAARNFFAQKHEWSVIKDSIRGNYLRPYLTKIARTGKAVRIADCFAGKGRFDDGKDGSPIIIKNAVYGQLHRTPRASIETVFIEKKYIEELRRNLGAADHIHILEGDYEERMQNLVEGYDARNKNLFLYVDPYGVKSLKMSHFKSVSDMPFHTLEALINFNAHGFLREGCRLMKDLILDGQPLEEEYERDVNSPENLDAIAGGDYWRMIVEEYYRTRNLHTAEDALVAGYTAQLRNVFKYVIQFPVKVKLSHIAKYRMIYGTNHEDGLLLMADNMALRWKEFRDKVRPQQMLIEMDFPEQTVGMSRHDIQMRILNLLDKRISLKDLLVHLIRDFGVSFSLSELKKEMQDLQKEKRILVIRSPEKHPSGRTITGWDHTGRDGYTVQIERNPQWQQNLL